MGARARARRGVDPRRLPDVGRASGRVRALAREEREEADESPFAADPTAVRGAITPLVTPFTEDGALDLGAIKPLIDWQLEQGTHGISVGGSTGEPTSKTVEERIAVMRAAAEAVDGRVPSSRGRGARSWTRRWS